MQETHKLSDNLAALKEKISGWVEDLAPVFEEMK